MTIHKNMYRLSVKQWNPFVGCQNECIYCVPSFQAQLKRFAKKNCKECYKYLPHTHPNRLSDPLPRTSFMQFIFTCCSGDIAFCPTDYLQQIIAGISLEKDKYFLIQSKDPATFARIIFPNNVILGTTLETNRDALYKGITQAPKPSQRYQDFLKIEHPLKMVTIEPVIDFDLDIMMDWLKNINPCLIWIGYDSKRCLLPEPELEKVKQLYWELGKKGFVVVLKTIREARK